MSKAQPSRPSTPAPSDAADAPFAEPPDRFNFANYLFTVNATRPLKAAFVDDLARLSYGDLERRSRHLAQALTALGVRREERVLLLMLDTNDWPVSFLGAMYAGIVPVAANTLLTAQDYAYLLENSRAQAVLVSGTLLSTLLSALDQARHEVRKIVVSQPVSALGQGCVEFEALLQAQSPAPAPADTGADDPGSWLYSSGSTGRPKGAVHSQINPYWTAELYGKAVLQLHENDVCFSAAKLFFAYGLGNSLSFALSVGATTLLMAERPTPDAVFKRWLGALGGVKPTAFFGAPTGFAGLLANPHLPPRDAVSLRLVSSAGEALPAEIGERFERHFGVAIIDGIGSTEMLHIFLSNRPERFQYGTTGWPVPGYQVELRGDDGQPLTAHPDGSIDTGDLYIQGPTAALMYWGNRDKSRETFQGPWTKSGDKYLRNADGSYTYAGRSDDMLKVSGIYVSPFEVESMLAQHPAVELVAITSRGESGTPVADMFPSLRGRVSLRFSDPAAAGLEKCDLVFFATPNGIAMEQAPVLLDAGVKVIDLAADFRLKDKATWEKWYGMPHANPSWLAKAVYGLPEVNREKIRDARLVANPGCYPTATQLGFLPLIETGCVDASSLIADVKSGVSGAGRKAETHVLFSEAADNFKAYGVSGHRHLPEIRQGLSVVAGQEVGLTFVPHLTPMIRGIHATLYARVTKEVDFQSIFEQRYKGEPFVDVLPPKSHPETRSVRASNTCRIAVHRPQNGNTLVVLSVIDNLVKGAAGQAVQNMNLMFGFDECLGLSQIPVLP
jgi:benzoate-CoA ligase